MGNNRKPDYKELYPGISDEVVSFLKKSDRKMEYQEYDLKRESFVFDREWQNFRFLPSREDSLDRLMENNVQFKDEHMNTEEMVVHYIMIEKMRCCLNFLAKDDRKLIEEIYFNNYSERELAKLTEISQSAIHKRKVKILGLLKELMEK